MGWSTVLDELERGAEECERYFLGSHDGSPPELIDIPTDLEPLPEHLAARARAVLRRIDGVNARLARVPRPSSETGRTRFAGSSATQPVAVDRSL